MKSYCDYIFMAYFHNMCFHIPYVVEWTIPTVSGDIPPPSSGFSFTQFSSVQAVMFGGNKGTVLSSGNVYLATVGRESVVCENWWWLSFD